MEVQNSYFTTSAYEANRYFMYPSPPHILSQQTLIDSIFTKTEEAFQMQHNIRFPTPPHTPPKTVKLSPHPQEATQQRTQSVIMKVGHVKDTNPMDTNEDTEQSTEQDISNNEFVCNWLHCKRIFESLELLAAHVTQEHAVASLNDGLYYCRWSGCLRTDRGFNARYKMLVHVRTHTKEKPHQCHLCEKKFSRAENLKIHIRSHSGEKPYICTFEGCQKAYSNSSDRFKHTRTHSMEKPYMCKVPGCQKRYTDPSSLRKHVKTFKHALQIIDDNSSFRTQSNPSPPAIQTIHSEPTNTSSPITHHYLHKYETQASTYLCNSPTTNYYMGIAEEDICHLKASQYDSYYDDAHPNSIPYWITDNRCRNIEVAYHSSYPAMQRESNHHMNMDIDAPLDLRVINRK
ncbi:zinc finger protein GLIS2 homolog [Teleopsis dalmanni]|uniref:zinc finger protein GLIS2 homolog n=1 Tax=Teleopsis dalmanni TaxID=139649 RepID=UPI0018CFCA00|nr:zinc finger protein GLIS2 homolog [Teleopsis dalmanni]